MEYIARIGAIVLCLLIVSGCAALRAGEPTATDWYEGGILASQRYDDPEVERCIAALGKIQQERLRCVAIRATQLEFEGKTKDAFTLMRNATGGIGGLAKLPDDVVFQFWRLLAKVEDPAKAISVLQEIGTKPIGRSQQIRCLSTMAEIDLYFQRYASALANAKAADVGAHLPQSSSGSERVDDFLIQQTDALVTRIESVIDIMEHGAGFHLYLKGNEQFRGKKYKDAIGTYGRLLDMHVKNKGNPVIPIISPDDPKFSALPIHDVYADASCVYQADAYLHVGDFASVIKTLAPLIAKKDGPYYGEALIVQAQALLCCDGPSKDVTKSLSLSLGWADREAKKENDYASYQIPKTSEARTRPATTMRHADAWSNIAWFEFEPNQVYNSNTCSWYKDYITYRARTLRSMAYFMGGATEKALDDLNAIVQVDPFDYKLTQNSMPSNYLRLRDDYLGRRLFATSNELALFNGDMLYRLALAELHLELEMFDDADSMYALIQSSFKDKMSNDQQAYISYARASCHSFMGQGDAAITFLKPFTAKWKDTLTAPRALVLWADYQGDATHAAAVLDVAMKSASGTPMVREIMFRKAQFLYAGGFYTDAKVLFTQLKKSSKDTFLMMQCKNYLDQISEDTQKGTP